MGSAGAALELPPCQESQTTPARGTLCQAQAHMAARRRCWALSLLLGPGCNSWSRRKHFLTLLAPGLSY